MQNTSIKAITIVFQFQNNINWVVVENPKIDFWLGDWAIVPWIRVMEIHHLDSTARSIKKIPLRPHPTHKTSLRPPCGAFVMNAGGSLIIGNREFLQCIQ
jgi:hypothetical protein